MKERRVSADFRNASPMVCREILQQAVLCTHRLCETRAGRFQPVATWISGGGEL
jgi:hypothetical protein